MTSGTHPGTFVSLGALALLILGGCERRAGVFFEASSPQHRYTITLSGNPRRAWSPSSAHVIRANVQREGVQLIRSREIHFADWMDDSWEQDYVGHEWVYENVLRFQARYPTPLQRHRTSDVLSVKNAASQAVSFLRIATAADLILLFDLAPGSTTSVTATGRTDVNWFNVDGTWLDGTQLPSAAPNFHDLPRAGSEITLAVNPDAVSVTRRELPSNKPLQPTTGSGAAGEK